MMKKCLIPLLFGLLGSFASFSHAQAPSRVDRLADAVQGRDSVRLTDRADLLANDVLARLILDSNDQMKYSLDKAPWDPRDRGAFNKFLPTEVMSEKITRGGTFLQLDFETTGLAKPYVLLSKDPMFAEQQEDGHWFLTDIGDTYESGEMGNVHRIVFKDLEPNTLYFMVILLQLPQETEFVGYKALNLNETTKKRRVDVDYDLIYVIDDSDDFGCGELYFMFQLGHPNANFYDPGNTWDSDDLWRDVASGELVQPEVRLTAIDTPAQVKVAISCNDNDVDLIGDWFEIDEYSSFSGDEYLGTGINSDHEWNSGSWTFNVAGTTEMSEGDTLSERERFSFSRVRDVDESDCSDLEYRVTMLIHVSYQ